jgi:hypothetical protein
MAKEQYIVIRYIYGKASPIQAWSTSAPGQYDAKRSWRAQA